MAVLPMLAQANHIERDLEGYWDNYQSQTTIKVRAKRYGFKIKGIYGQNRWTKFRRNHRGQYRDARGNKLIIRSRNRIEFINRYNRLITPFRRQGTCASDYGYGAPYNDYYQYEQYYDGYYDDYNSHQYRNRNRTDGYYRGDERRRQKDYKPDTNRHSYTPIRIDQDRLRKIEGTWKSEGRGRNSKKVIVVSTRDGIKVKDTTTNKWHRYKLSSDQKSLIDEKGNIYQVGKKSLYWTSNNSKRILKLDKISSSTF